MSRIRAIKPEDCPRQSEIWDKWSLYLIVEENTGNVKVGTAWHPRRRLSTLQAGNPRRLSLKYVFVGERGELASIEKLILKKLADYRLVGEWLSSPIELILAEIASLVGFE